MVHRERKTIRAPMEEVDIKYSSLGSAFDTMQRLVEKYGRDADIDTYQYPYEESETLYVYAMRPETDSEMTQRIAREEQWEKRKEEQDAQEYERLKKKFESK